jgi:hypothetical protein
LIEILTPFFPAYFVLMASVANIGKNIGWLASAATRAAIHKGFTKVDNLGDVTAKSGAQGTAAGLVGTGFGIGISWFLGSTEGQTIDPSLLFGVFAPLSLINISAAYLGNFSVVTRTLNEERLQLAFKPFISGLIRGENLEIETPDYISKKESLVVPKNHIFRTPLLLSPPLIDVISGSNSSLISSLESDFCNKNYRIYISPERSVCIWFIKGASNSEKLSGYFHACVVRQLLDDSSDIESVRDKSLEIISKIDIAELLKSKGWEINNLHLGARENSSVTIHYE